MSVKYKGRIYIVAAFMIAVFCLASGQSRAKPMDINVFEEFRSEMAVDPAEAAGNFMGPEAIVKWNAGIASRFSTQDRQINHFFATAMIIPKARGEDLFILYFNPWVDGVFFTQWKKAGQAWKVINFYMASGERVRGLATPGAAIAGNQIPPVWLWWKGALLKNLFAYYTDMRNRLITRPVEDCISWFSLIPQEAGLDLQRVKLRMAARQISVDAYMNTGAGGAALDGAYSKLKYNAITRNAKALSVYSRDSDILVKLKPKIIKSLKANWIFHKNGIYTTILSPAIAPRYFLFVNTADNGKISSVTFNNLEVMARSGKAIIAPPSARKVQRYKTANGDEVEIIIEKRGGKVTQTTRINGKVTEVLNF